jgi:two-component system, OmpR family, sensor kinase
VKQKGLRYILASAIITTALSLLIGGFATISVKNSQISVIDSQLNTIADSVRQNSDAPVSAALDSAAEQDFNVTIALVSASGELTIINESQLDLRNPPAESVIDNSLQQAVTVDVLEGYRLVALKISGGDRLLIADSLRAINETFVENLKRLVLFTFLADAVAIALSYLVIRRNNRKLQADSLARMQSFLADASHELRTPLTVIKGYSEMLAKGQISVESDRQKAFDRVNSEIVRMENLIHDLLLLAELGETTEPIREEVDLSELLGSYARDFKTLNSERSVAIEIEDGLTCLGSADHLKRLILNILNNISRHTPVDAPVEIKLSRNGKRVSLLIEDGGPGLPETSYRDGIELLNRFDTSRSRESGGSGLGLSIIAAIVHEHGGTLALRKSTLGGLAVEAII